MMLNLPFLQFKTSHTFRGIDFLDIRLACFQFFDYIDASWKVFKFLRRWGVCEEKVEMYIYFNKAKAFLETFSDSGFKFLISL